jgi:hypothetical protein
MQAPVPGVPGVHPAQAVHPYCSPQAPQPLDDGVPLHVPGDPHPWQLPQLAVNPHCVHEVYVGVPEHVGPVLKRCGGGAAFATDVAQQILASPEQSLSDWHGLGHVFWQIPSQHSSPVDAQSVDAVHALGHGS